MANETPFQILQDIDQRCRDNGTGLPTGAQEEQDWIGIGFSLAGQRLIAKMSDVTEILPPPSTIRLPGVKTWVKGLANIRGNLMPILDMNDFLQGAISKTSKDNRILVINKDGVNAGLLVDEVFGLRRFKPEMIEQQNYADSNVLRPYLDGAFSDTQFQWDIFNVKKLVNHEQFLKVV